jgi:hypothetical protein
MSKLLKMIHTFSTVAIKTQWYLCRNGKIHHKVYMEIQGEPINLYKDKIQRYLYLFSQFLFLHL